LLTHPAVAQAVAFAAPHASLGEAVVAAVVLRPGATATENDLRIFISGRLVDFKVPEKILLLDEIPRGPTGKIQRIGLAAKLGIEEIRETRAPRLHDNFFDLGGDSLLATITLARIRQATGAEIPLISFLQNPTVQGVAHWIANGPESDSSLRLLIRPGESPALFCIPGSHGNLVGFFRLAQHLDPRQPVTAFQLPKVEAGSSTYSIEQLAGRYVEEMLALQSDGPYHLAGACTGGFVAYEMARQLRAKGKTIGLLSLMDCYNHAFAGALSVNQRMGYRLGSFQKRMQYHWRNLRKLGIAGAGDYLQPRWLAFRQAIRERSEEWAYRLFLRAGLPLPAMLHDPRLAIRRAAAKYEPPPDWPGSLQLFCVEEPRADAYDYPEMGWQGSALGGSTMHPLPGSHMAMLSEPSVAVLARELSACLAACLTLSAAGDRVVDGGLGGEGQRGSG
jgi:oxalate---CoA ligase